MSDLGALMIALAIFMGLIGLGMDVRAGLRAIADAIPSKPEE